MARYLDLNTRHILSSEYKLLAVSKADAEWILDGAKVSAAGNPRRELALKVAELVLEFAGEEIAADEAKSRERAEVVARVLTPAEQVKALLEKVDGDTFPYPGTAKPEEL